MRITWAHILTVLIAPLSLAQPTEVRRVVRTIDFEERRLGNAEELPMHWNKVQGPGLPHYVNGRLTTDRAHGGRYSFRLDLDGGSIAYRYDPGEIKVQPGARYRVQGYIQTTPLTHARARVTAYFTDIDGHVIAASVTHSEPFASTVSNGPAPADPWHHISIELAASNPAAAWLVLELELLQPALYAPNSLGPRTLYVQDIRGTAWFDDVTVAQVPAISLTTARPGNIFRRSDPLRMDVMVIDPFTADLASQVLIRDAAGRPVYQRSGMAEMADDAVLAGRHRMPVLLPDLPAGWYEVTLGMSSQGQVLGSQTVPVIVLADDAPPVAPDPRFGLIATALPPEAWPQLPQLLPMLGAGRIKLAIWSSKGDADQLDPAAFDALLVSMQEQQIAPTACLVGLPPSIVAKLQPPADPEGVDASRAAAAAARPAPTETESWARLLGAKPEDWQPQLGELVARYASHLDRWQLGDDTSDAFATRPAMRRVYDAVYAQFAALVAKPDLAMPWPAWYELDGRLPATVALALPPSILPHQIPLYLQDLKPHEGHHLSVSLQPLGREPYGREVQVRDLAQRVVYALAAGAERIDVPLPLGARLQGDQLVPDPQELFLPVRTLMTTLGGATYKGRVPIGEGVEAFLFDKRGQGILAMWDVGRGAAVKELAVNLGESPRRLDLWGNATPLLRPATADGSGTVQLAVGQVPIFLTDIDGPLAQLRASVALDQPLIESTFTSHKRRLRFTNCHPQTISGTLRLKAPPGWSIGPSVHNFSLSPGETFDRELTIEFPYNSNAGPRDIPVEFLVQAERTTRFTMPVTVKLGLSDVGMQVVAIRDGKDVVVQQIIQNYGERPIDYTAFAIYPGQSRQERLVNGLAPGRTVIKRYRFPDARVAPDTRVRVGVKELAGTRILNDEVEVR